MKSILSLLLFAFVVAAAAVPAFGQNPSPAPAQTPSEADEVLRVSTNLVQTDVTVVDRKGKFVDGLRLEQFEIKVDGQVQPIDFFERLIVGSRDEARRIAAARGERVAPEQTPTASTIESAGERPRSIIFFVDDLNLTPEGVARTREVLLNFIDRQWQPNTQVLIAASSGQLRFFQQFTDDREVLRAAARRIKYQSRASIDSERPTMTVYQALQIDRNDRDALAFHMQQLSSQFPGISANEDRVRTIENMVRMRARRIRQQSALQTRGVIETLESAVAARSGETANRQIMFFISEGFVLDTQSSDISYRLQRSVDAAARNNTIVYTLDARGLATGAVDASDSRTADLAIEADSLVPAGRALAGDNSFAALSASQDTLRIIAEDTGGRALLNTNGLEKAVQQTLDETASYYLLAWRPARIEEKTGKPKFRRLEVRVKDRPDLKVRVRRGFFTSPEPVAELARANAASGPAAAAAVNTPHAVLNRALNAANEQRGLTLELYPLFANVEAATSMLSAHIQLDPSRLLYADVNKRQQADVDVACVLLDENGKVVASDGRALTLTGNAAAAGMAADANAARPLPLKFSFSFRVNSPGIYQFRVAARDRASGVTGTRFGWLVVPELKPNRLALSTLLITAVERTQTKAANAGGGLESQLKIERRFNRRSRLMMQLYLYHAARRAATGANGATPEVMIEIKVLRGSNVMLSAPPHQASVADAADLSRILYTAQIPLAGLSVGAYTLQVTATDQVAKTSRTREINFAVE